jgi:hypothetical protein
MLFAVSIKYSGVLKRHPKGTLSLFPEIGSFWTSRHFSTNSGLMLDLIAWTCSRESHTSKELLFKWIIMNRLYKNLHPFQQIN